MIIEEDFLSDEIQVKFDCGFEITFKDQDLTQNEIIETAQKSHGETCPFCQGKL